MRKGYVVLLTLVLLFSSVAAVYSQSRTVTHGPVSGEVSDTSATLWARGSGEGTLLFEVATNADFSGTLIKEQVKVTDATDFTGKAQIKGLTAGQNYFYRASLDGSKPVTGQFHTTPAGDKTAGFNFVFGACLGGQGYCRDPKTGWTIFKSMQAQKPDFFMMLGDGVYIDSACPITDNRNVPGAEKVATEINGIRARYRYHLEDPNYAAFLAQTPVYVTWDDHEFRDDAGGPVLQSMNPQLLADARQAYFEYWPVAGTKESYKLYRKVSYGAMADFFILDLRSYRDPNVNWDPNPRTNVPKTMMGKEQFDWLRQALEKSTAKWKFIVSSVPLSYPTGFPQPEVDGHDGWARGPDRTGYETELASLLFFLSSRSAKNVVFLTGDAHWPFATSYDPDRDGQPNFYEFSSSPLSAIVLPPPIFADKSPAVSKTFNPTVLFADGTFQGNQFNFGHVAIADDGSLNLRLMDRDGKEMFKLVLKAQ